MLLRQILLDLLLVSLCVGQHYDSDEYDEHDGPDYSKYYAANLNQPTTASVFNGPQTLSRFFQPFFAADGKEEQQQQQVGNGQFSDFRPSQSFGNFDYFEQNQQKYENLPGSSYIAQQIVPTTPYLTKPLIVDPKYVPQYSNKQLSEQTPYEKYSFQPVSPKQYEYSAASSEQKLKTHMNCKKVSDKSDAKLPKDCFVCSDAKSGSTYKHCSYGGEESVRAKRYTPKKEERTKEVVDPYDYVKSQSRQYYADPDFEEQYRAPKLEEYRFGPEYFDDDGDDKSESEKQSEQLVKSGENCQRVVKEDMICMVCRNEKNGGNYEQCQFSSHPAEKKYAYVKEHKYNSKDDKPTRKRKVKKNFEDVEEIQPVNTSKEQRRSNKYSVPQHFEKIEEGDAPDDSEYYYKEYPQKEEQKQKEDDGQYGYYGQESKKDVETVLAEFAKKDRSKCEKAEKNGMTCYLCTDSKGVKHEECMYVSESKPTKTYAAYHAKTNDDDVEDDGNVEESREVKKPLRNYRRDKNIPLEQQQKQSR